MSHENGTELNFNPNAEEKNYKFSQIEADLESGKNIVAEGVTMSYDEFRKRTYDPSQIYTKLLRVYLGSTSLNRWMVPEFINGLKRVRGLQTLVLEYMNVLKGWTRGMVPGNTRLPFIIHEGARGTTIDPHERKVSLLDKVHIYDLRPMEEKHSKQLKTVIIRGCDLGGTCLRVPITTSAVKFYDCIGSQAAIVSQTADVDVVVEGVEKISIVRQWIAPDNEHFPDYATLSLHLLSQKSAPIHVVNSIITGKEGDDSPRLPSPASLPGQGAHYVERKPTTPPTDPRGADIPNAPIVPLANALTQPANQPLVTEKAVVPNGSVVAESYPVPGISEPTEGDSTNKTNVEGATSGNTGAPFPPRNIFAAPQGGIHHLILGNRKLQKTPGA
ncbi:MAG: hypothetical protein LBU87_05175 [Lactobacillales bacterium]|jgi:hypothetical protein|nr:hypothetical protein [Lactobacillales bacterium]